MRTRYRIDSYQKTYFVIDSFEQLMEATAPDFTPIYARLAEQDSLPAGTVLDRDEVVNRGRGGGGGRGGACSRRPRATPRGGTGAPARVRGDARRHSEGNE